MKQNDSRAELFLKSYRILEGLLEKRYSGKKVGSSSVVMEYLRDPDSAQYRTELDLCREIRNILTHNSDKTGEAVVEPSIQTLEMLQKIIEHVQRPVMAIDYGTPRDRIMFAHPNEAAIDVMRHMLKNGYSHVPVKDRSGLTGVFSAGSLFMYFGEKGFDAANGDVRIGDLKNALELSDERSEKYAFFPVDATLPAVKEAFEKRSSRNSRLSVVFITQNGDRNEEILAMLTPWDVLREDV